MLLDMLFRPGDDRTAADSCLTGCAHRRRLTGFVPRGGSPPHIASHAGYEGGEKDYLMRTCAAAIAAPLQLPPRNIGKKAHDARL
jgi:hypothetical protein